MNHLKWGKFSGKILTIKFELHKKRGKSIEMQKIVILILLQKICSNNFEKNSGGGGWMANGISLSCVAHKRKLIKKIKIYVIDKNSLKVQICLKN